VGVFVEWDMRLEAMGNLCVGGKGRDEKETKQKESGKTRKKGQRQHFSGGPNADASTTNKYCCNQAEHDLRSRKSRISKSVYHLKEELLGNWKGNIEISRVSRKWGRKGFTDRQQAGQKLEHRRTSGRCMMLCSISNVHL